MPTYLVNPSLPTDALQANDSLCAWGQHALWQKENFGILRSGESTASSAKERWPIESTTSPNHGANAP